MTGAGDVWSSFTCDPRLPEHAPLRASDADREVVHQVLTEAYADGRLDREEFDVRSTDVISARTLGELPPLMADLVPERALATRGKAALVSAGPDELRRLAEAEWDSARRAAVMSFVAPTLICWAIWLAVNFGESYAHAFPWPLIVMAATGVHLVRTMVNKQEFIAEGMKALEKRQLKALKPRRSKDGDSQA